MCSKIIIASVIIILISTDLITITEIIGDPTLRSLQTHLPSVAAGGLLQK